MEVMTIGMCLDYIEAYVEMHNPKQKAERRGRKAVQADFDSF